MPRMLLQVPDRVMTPEKMEILNKYVENIMQGVEKPISNTAKQLDLTYSKVSSAVQSKTVKEFLDELGLNNETAAQILMNKVKQHSELEPGADRDTPKYLDMLFKITGSYANKVEMLLDTKSDALDMVQNIIKGSYEIPNPEEEDEEEEDNDNQ